MMICITAKLESLTVSGMKLLTHVSLIKQHSCHFQFIYTRLGYMLTALGSPRPSQMSRYVTSRLHQRTRPGYDDQFV